MSTFWEVVIGEFVVPNDDSAPIFLALVATIQVMFWMMVSWLVMKLALISWLMWDRYQQNKSERERVELNSELYHAVRNLLSSVKGRLLIKEVTDRQTAKELTEQIEQVPPKTAKAVMEELEQSDSTVNKIPTVPHKPPPQG